MTHIGQVIFGTYSFLAIAALMIMSVKKAAKGKGDSWELIVLLPVLIFVANMI